jgi:proteasome lid subunit RPN8/RPN11
MLTPVVLRRLVHKVGTSKNRSMLNDQEKALIIRDNVAVHIQNHGRETYPNECCGALIGTDNVVGECFSLPNTTEEGPRRRFLVSPDDYRTAERRATKFGHELIGFYHSHPDHPARPSQYDLDHAWPVFTYVIIAVEKGEPGVMTSWRLREDRSAFDEARIERRNE